MTKTNHSYFGVLTALLAMMVASGVALAATTTGSNSSTIRLEDVGPADLYPSHISVQNLKGNIGDLDLQLNNFSHGFPDDVDVLLVGPKGQRALLMSDVGGKFPVPGGDTIGLTLRLDDEASVHLPDGAKLATGVYKPTQGTTPEGEGHPAPANFPRPAPAGPYASRLSVFDGTDPNGTWSLYVLDDSATDSGAVGGWVLKVTTDAKAPKVISTIPAAGATGVSPTANVRATFSEDMRAPTINGATLTLFEKGSPTRVGASVSYDAAADKATLDPTNSLKRGVTYKAVVTTDARDRAGNRLDQNASLSGLQQKVWSFKVKQ